MTLSSTASTRPMPEPYQYMMPSQAKLDRVVASANGFIDIMLGSILDVADSYMRDCVESLKKERLFRMQVKREINLAFAEYEKLKRKPPKEHPEKLALYLDILDAVQDSVKNDITRFYYPIKQVLDKHHVPHSHALALSEVVWSIINIGCRCFDVICEAMRIQMGISLKPWFKDDDPRQMLRHWELATYSLCRYPVAVRQEAFNSPEIKNAITVIEKKLLDKSQLDKSITVAAKMNPEAMEEYYQRNPQDRLD